MNITSNVKLSRVSNAVAAGTTTVNCSSVDMAGFNSATFTLLAGTINDSPEGTLSIKVQGSDRDTSPEVWSDLAGTNVAYTVSDDNKLAAVEVVSPRTRYLRPVIVRGNGNATIDGVVALQSSASSEPVTHDSTVVSTEVHLSPASGTA